MFSKRGIVAISLCLASLALGDTLYLKDGTKLTGQVAQNGADYVVTVRYGTLNVPGDTVSRWEKDSTPAANTTAPPDTKPSPAAGPTAPALPAAPSGQQLAGEQALAGFDYKTAATIFEAIVKKEPRNSRALHGLGLAYLKMDRVPLAETTLNRAYEAAGADVSRSLLLNTVSANVTCKYPARALKRLIDYCTKPGRMASPDEPVINALGVVLLAEPEDQRSSAQYHTAQAIYQAADQKLAEAHPGHKRYGETWLLAAEAATKNDNYNLLHTSLVAALTADAVSDRAMATAEDEMNRANGSLLSRNHQSILAQAQFDLNNAQAQKRQTAAAVELAQTAISEVNPFPSGIPVQPIDSEPVVVAVATPNPAPDPVDVAKPHKNHHPAPDAAPDAPQPTDNPHPARPHPITPSPDPTPEPTPDPAPAPPAPKAPVDTKRHANAVAVATNLAVAPASLLNKASSMVLRDARGKIYKASVVRIDEKKGLALLKVEGNPLEFLAIDDKFNGGDITVAAFDRASMFSDAPDVYRGKSDAPSAKWTVAFDDVPPLPGAPIVSNNLVVGIEMVTATSRPENVPAISGAELKEFVGADSPADEANAPDGNHCVLHLIVEGPP